MELYKLTVHEVRDLFHRGETNPLDLMDSSLRRIDKLNENLSAFIALRDLNLIIEETKMLSDKMLDNCADRRGWESDLLGIPYGVQDNICVEGMMATCGSKILEGFVSPYDASSIKELKGEGAIAIGRLNMDEFGMGFSTENSCYGPTLNPWDISRTAGGGGGGCAAAVASDQVFYAIGSDGAGCLRQPASFSGVVGLKPTRGLVSRYGLISASPSLEEIGILAKDVEDCLMVLKGIAFYDGKDPASVRREGIDYDEFSKGQDLKGIKVGIPEEIFREGWDPDIENAIAEAMKGLQGLGAELIDVGLPYFKFAKAAHYIIRSYESAGSLSRYDGIRYGYSIEGAEDPEDLYKKVRAEGFGQEVKAGIMLGNLFLGTKYYDSHYKNAQRVRNLLVEDFKRAYNKCHIIMTPTCPVTAYGLQKGEPKALGMDRSHDYTLPANLTGLPALSIPCGFSHRGLPIGMQFMGKAFEEDLLLRCGYAFQANTDHHMKRPTQLEVGL